MLSEGKINECFESCDGTRLSAARAIEASVLAELEKQEPVAWVVESVEYNAAGERPILREVDYYNEVIDKLPAGTKLYAAPVVQPGMVTVPREPTEAMIQAWKQYGSTVEKGWSAMLAAAEKN